MAGSEKDFGRAEIAPAIVTPEQDWLFGRKIIIRYPQSVPSADSLGEVEADDGHRYYIKGDAHGRPVRASEWICSGLAEAVGIATPTGVVVEADDGSTAFGSRRIANVADQLITSAFLTTPTIANADGPVTGANPLQTHLSSIYAFDLFTANDDRHLGNYLTVDDQGKRRLYAFDFSRAMFWSWPWTGPMEVQSNTRLAGTLLRSRHGFDQQAANTTLDRLRALPLQGVKGFLNGMPAEWLAPELRSEFLAWWSDGQHVTRSEEIRKGLTDGSLL